MAQQHTDDALAGEIGEQLEVSFRFSIGELHTESASFALFNVKIKHLCVVANNRMATLKVYTNNFNTLLDTRKIPLADKEVNVLLGHDIGRLNNAQFEFSFPTAGAELADIGDYDMNTFAVGFIPEPQKEGY